MRWIVIGMGVVVFLTGVVWTLQGIGILGGSFMSGQTLWAGLGMVTLLIGLGVCAAGLTMDSGPPRL